MRVRTGGRITSAGDEVFLSGSTLRVFGFNTGSPLPLLTGRLIWLIGPSLSAVDVLAVLTVLPKGCCRPSQWPALEGNNGAVAIILEGKTDILRPGFRFPRSRVRPSYLKNSSAPCRSLAPRRLRYNMKPMRKRRKTPPPAPIELAITATFRLR